MKEIIVAVVVCVIVLSGGIGLSYLAVDGSSGQPVEYRIVCLMPLTQGEKPTTKLILHDVQTKNRVSADIVGSDGSYRPMYGEVCFFQGEPPSDE